MLYKTSARFDRLFAATVSLMVILTSGCTSYRPVAVHGSQLQDALALGVVLRPGDRVRLHLADGEIREVEVASLSDVDLTTDDGDSVDFSKIETIESRTLSKGKTTAAVVGGSLVVTILLLGAALSSLVFFP